MSVDLWKWFFFAVKRLPSSTILLIGEAIYMILRSSTSCSYVSRIRIYYWWYESTKEVSTTGCSTSHHHKTTDSESTSFRWQLRAPGVDHRFNIFCSALDLAATSTYCIALSLISTDTKMALGRQDVYACGDALYIHVCSSETHHPASSLLLIALLIHFFQSGDDRQFGTSPRCPFTSYSLPSISCEKNQQWQ